MHKGRQFTCSDERKCPPACLWDKLRAPKSKSKIKHIAYTGGKQQVLHFASCGLMDVPSRIFRVKLEMILVKITYKTFCAVLLCIIFEIFAYILLSPDLNKMQIRLYPDLKYCLGDILTER